MNWLSWLFLLCFVLLTSSCVSDMPKSVLHELDKMTKANKNKFEKVIDYYSGKKNKLRRLAVYHIIENINDFGFYKSDQLKNYDALFDVLSKKPEDYKKKLPWYSSEVDNIMDSLETIYGKIDPRQLYAIRDIDSFTAKGLINYIESAFKAYNYPWCKNLSFHDFCEYILPYRNGSEELENWRPMFEQEYNWIWDSIDSKSDWIQVAEILNRNAELKYAKGLGRYPSAISPSNMIKSRFGACTDMANYKAMVMRTFGVPIATDFFPQWGTDHNTHYWNALMDENGNMVGMDSLISDKNAGVAYKFTIAKVYRKTFSKQKEITEVNSLDEPQHIPSLFRDMRMKDVTDTYITVSDITLELNDTDVISPLVYLCVFNDQGFTPIAFAKVENNEAQFTNLGRGVIYFPFYVKNERFIPAANSFIIQHNGTIQYKEPVQTNNKLVLTRKYHMHRRKSDWLQCLVKGRFEGANYSDFSDAETLAIINKKPSQHMEEIKVNNSNSYKYLRFVFDPSELELEYDDDGACIAEIEFVDWNGNLIKGVPQGTDGQTYSEYTPDKCFDGKVLTFFEDPRKGVIGKWVGLYLEEPRMVSKIKYCARNDLNCVQKGDVYELFYWNNTSFISMGQQLAQDTFLIYNNCPDNAIFWLKNLSGGKEERIFTYEKDKQVWW